VPVVVTISGSGPQERDSRLSVVKGYMPFREIADTLGRRGIAVLRYDDRGVGESGGRGALRDTATSADFADDVLSVVQYLRTRSDVDGARIALAGHSEGGLIAPLAAAKDPSIGAVVLIAGPAYNGRRILEYQNDIGIKAAPGLTTTQRDSIRARVPAALDSIARSSRWMRYFMSEDPLVTARQLKQPVLILQGDTDMQVTPEQADTLARVIRGAGNRSVTMRRFPATNHLLLNDPSGSPFGYGKLTDVRVRREVLGALADWLVTTLK
jgi:alpha-beta hydrolase superfamily lysophospholipase